MQSKAAQGMNCTANVFLVYSFVSLENSLLIFAKSIQPFSSSRRTLSGK